MHKHTPAPWFIEKDSWLKGHVSIGTKDHGAMIQVVGEMHWVSQPDYDLRLCGWFCS